MVGLRTAVLLLAEEVEATGAGAGAGAGAGVEAAAGSFFITAPLALLDMDDWGGQDKDTGGVMMLVT